MKLDLFLADIVSIITIIVLIISSLVVYFNNYNKFYIYYIIIFGITSLGLLRQIFFILDHKVTRGISSVFVICLILVCFAKIFVGCKDFKNRLFSSNLESHLIAIIGLQSFFSAVSLIILLWLISKKSQNEKEGDKVNIYIADKTKEPLTITFLVLVTYAIYTIYTN